MVAPNPTPEDVDLTPEEAARRLRLHPETVRRWLRAGRMFPHAYRISRRAGWRIPASDVARIKRPQTSPEEEERRARLAALEERISQAQRGGGT
jgi:excisionase family DNA binding protein